MTEILGMKALSIHQPYAGLIATGAKTIETRSYATKHRGPIVICSTQCWHPEAKWAEEWKWIPDIGALADRCEHSERLFDLFGCDADQIDGAKIYHELDEWALSFYGPQWQQGAALGIADLVNCLPVIGTETGESELPEGLHIGSVPAANPPQLYTWDNRLQVIGDITDQLARGDFTPGNYGWMLENFKPFDQPIPVKGQQQIWTVKPSNLRGEA